MRFLFLLSTVILSAGAQSALPSVSFNFAEVKAYLNLTDAQLQGLEDIQKARMQAQQAIYQQINQKQQELNSLLQSGSTDALRIGQLTIDINALRKQTPVPGDSYRNQALAVLAQDQKNKLNSLSAALQLQQTAWQAINLNLIDAPQPKPLPMMPPSTLPFPIPATVPIGR